MIHNVIANDKVDSQLTLAELARVTDVVGISMSDLLNVQPWVAPEETPADDVAVLAQVLMSDNRVHPEHRVATALGWTLDRLREAEALLAEKLHPTGLFVHRNTMGMSIRAADQRGAEAAKRLAVLRDDEEGIDQDQARVLYKAYKAELTANEVATARHAPKVADLFNRGLLQPRDQRGQRLGLTREALYAFDVPLESP